MADKLESASRRLFSQPLPKKPSIIKDFSGHAISCLLLVRHRHQMLMNTDNCNAQCRISFCLLLLAAGILRQVTITFCDRMFCRKGTHYKLSCLFLSVWRGSMCDMADRHPKMKLTILTHVNGNIYCLVASQRGSFNLRESAARPMCLLYSMHCFWFISMTCFLHSAINS